MVFFFQAEDGIRDRSPSRGLGDVYKRQPQKHGGAHRTYKSLASVETWKAKGIDDPIAYFQKEVDELNKNNKNKNSLKISDHSPELYLGYFPFISMMNKMDIKKYVDYFNLHNSFEFDLYELLSSLIYLSLIHI